MSRNISAEIIRCKATYAAGRHNSLKQAPTNEATACASSGFRHFRHTLSLDSATLEARCYSETQGCSSGITKSIKLINYLPQKLTTFRRAQVIHEKETSVGDGFNYFFETKLKSNHG